MHKDLKFSQDVVSEKASTGSEEVLTAVRFAKKVVIENPSTASQSQVSIKCLLFDLNRINFLKN